MKKNKIPVSAFLRSKNFSLSQAIQTIKNLRRISICKENGHDLIFKLGKGYNIGDHYICKHCGKIEWVDQKTE